MALKDGKTKEALPLINRAIELEGQGVRLPDFLDTRGVIYLLDGDVSRAIADLKAATANVATATSSRLFHLAQAYQKSNDAQKAKAVLEQAKNRGLPTGLHTLEQPAYERLLRTLPPG
jgi:lipopolysaccharide biosynthesis regulator YciM